MRSVLTDRSRRVEDLGLMYRPFVVREDGRYSMNSMWKGTGKESRLKRYMQLGPSLACRIGGW